MKMKWLEQALILGVAFFVAIYIIKPIGVSTQFNVLTGIVQEKIDPDLITEDQDAKYGYSSTNTYYDKEGGKLASEIMNPVNYSFIFVLAIPFGALFGRIVDKRRRKRQVIDSSAEFPMEGGFFKRYFRSFISGFLLLFGARMAGGCTSGHMMSGMMQGSISGFIFAACVFIVAIPLSIFTDASRRKR